MPDTVAMPTWTRAAAAAGWIVAAALAWRSFDAPPVSADRAEALLALHAELFEDIPRPTGSPAAARARERVRRALDAAGCPTQEHVAWSCRPGVCARVVNLWCRIEAGDRPAVVGMAHTDSVPAGPGAGDDGAGVVAWVDTVRRLDRDALARPFVLVLTDGEELGLLGARAWLADPPTGPIGEVVNLEARGTGGASLMFETVGPPRPWGRTFAGLGTGLNGSALYPAVYERIPNDTDLSEVRRAGIAGVNHAFLGNVAQYHTPLDDRAHLDPRSLAHHADLAGRWVRALQHPQEGAPVTFVDVFGYAVLWWPTAVGPAGAVLCAVGWLLWLVADLRGGRVRARELVAAGLGALAVPIVAALAAEALGAGIAEVAGPVWWGRPWPLRLATWCLTAACALGLGRVGTPLARWGAAVGIGCTALGVGVAVEPRLAVLGLPALAVGIGWRTAWARRPDLGVLGLGPATAVFWLPLAFGLEEALTALHLAVIAVPLGIALVGAGPAMPARPGRPAAALVLAALGFAAIAALGPAFTPERPRPTTAVWTDDLDGAELVTQDLLTGRAHTERRPGLGLPPPEVVWEDKHTARLIPARAGQLEVRADGPFRIAGATESASARSWIVGVPEEGVVITFDGPPGTFELVEETSGLPAEAGPRDVLFDGPAVPAHLGDRTRVELP